VKYIVFVLLLCSCFIINTCAANALNTMMGRIYNQMDYNSTGSLLAQLHITKKLLCAAQCANNFPTCNIAVFNGLAIMSQCSLFSELLIANKLIVSSNVVVYDFHQSKFQGMRHTKDRHQSLYRSHTNQSLRYIQFCTLLLILCNAEFYFNTIMKISIIINSNIIQMNI
jgi:hypothetical protein